MTSRSVGFWQALETIPGVAAVDAEWKDLFGEDHGAAKAFLRPSGRRALSYPCTIPRGCGCHHDVICHGEDDIVAVCHCERGCETFPLQRSEVVVYELDRPALEAALVKVLGLFKEADPGTDLPGATRIGTYFPYAGFEFPVYLTIQIEPVEFNEVLDGLLARNATSFILLSPTRQLCTAKAEKRMTDRKSPVVPLSENVAIEETGDLHLIRPVAEILAAFRAANLPSPKEGDAMVFFPTPPDATWRDVLIRFRDGHTVTIKVKSVRRVVNYTQMGMADNRNGNPTVQWTLLEAFADAHGVFDWTHSEAGPRKQKQRENLAGNLREFFRIEGDPFLLTDEGGWRARFQILPVE